MTSLAAGYDELGDPEKAWPLHREALNLARSLGARHVQGAASGSRRPTAQAVDAL